MRRHEFEDAGPVPDDDGYPWRLWRCDRCGMSVRSRTPPEYEYYYFYCMGPGGDHRPGPDHTHPYDCDEAVLQAVMRR